MAKRTKIIKIRATESEYAELVSRSRKPRLAEWIREYCLDAKIPKANKVPLTDPTLLRHLAGIGNNLNQIARVMNSDQWRPVDRLHVISVLYGLQRDLNALRQEHTLDDC